jgi:steroid delta-isomerase-like uncharacterized protein
MASTEGKNKELMRREVEEIFNEGKLELVDEYVAEDFVGHSPAAPEDSHGPEGYREYVRAARSAFPDLEVTIEDLIAEDDLVCRRTRFTGTHEGEFMGIEPTGNTVDVSGAVIYRIEDDQVAESWGQNDLMGMMEQLGVA